MQCACLIARQREGLELINSKVEYQLRSQKGHVVRTFDDPSRAADYIAEIDEKHGAKAPKLSAFKITIIEEAL